MRVPDEALRKSPFERIHYDGQHQSQDEEVQQGVVRGVSGEKAAWSNRAPDCACVEMRARKWTCEAIRSLRCAYAANVREGPVEDADLGECRDADGDELDGEELAGWDLRLY